MLLIQPGVALNLDQMGVGVGILSSLWLIDTADLELLGGGLCAPGGHAVGVDYALFVVPESAVFVGALEEGLVCLAVFAADAVAAQVLGLLAEYSEIRERTYGEALGAQVECLAVVILADDLVVIALVVLLDVLCKVSLKRVNADQLQVVRGDELMLAVVAFGPILRFLKSTIRIDANRSLEVRWPVEPSDEGNAILILGLLEFVDLAQPEVLWVPLILEVTEFVAVMNEDNITNVILDTVDWLG